LDLLERVSLIGLLHSLQHRLVDPEADAGREGREGQVGSDADHAELGQREEEQEHAAEHSPGLLHIPPVEQVNCWKERTEHGHTGLGPEPSLCHKEAGASTDVSIWLIDWISKWIWLPHIWVKYLEAVHNPTSSESLGCHVILFLFPNLAFHKVKVSCGAVGWR